MFGNFFLKAYIRLAHLACHARYPLATEFQYHSDFLASLFLPETEPRCRRSKLSDSPLSQGTICASLSKKILLR